MLRCGVRPERQMRECVSVSVSVTVK